MIMDNNKKTVDLFDRLVNATERAALNVPSMSNARSASANWSDGGVSSQSGAPVPAFGTSGSSGNGSLGAVSGLAGLASSLAALFA